MNVYFEELTEELGGEIVCCQLNPSCESRPTPRGGSTLTRVDKKKRLYLIGGANRHGQHFNDVYMYNLETNQWQRICSNADEFRARSGHTANLIREQEFLLIFGGLFFDDKKGEQIVYNDVSLFNCQTEKWQFSHVMSGKAPAARNAHTTVEISSNTLAIFGGSSPSVGVMNDLHLLHIEDIDHMRWEAVCCNGDIPPPRQLHCAAVVEMNGEHAMVIFGGSINSGDTVGDLHLLNTSTWTWKELNSSLNGRCSHVMTATNLQNLTIIGGFDAIATKILSDIWTYDFSQQQWIAKQIASDGPPLSRFGQAATTMANTGVFYVFGGMDLQSDFNDLYSISIK